MANEEDEFRKMAEIADAINDILETGETDTGDIPESESSKFTVDDGLEAAIAADLASPQDKQDEADNISSNKSGDSDLHLLSLRMRDTLAELRNDTEDTATATEALLGRMQEARDTMLEDMRRSITDFGARIGTREAVIQQEIGQMNQEFADLRTELEMMAVKYHQKNTKTHENYQENYEIERQRVNRYRDFLQFLLRERGI